MPSKNVDRIRGSFARARMPVIEENYARGMLVSVVVEIELQSSVIPLRSYLLIEEVTMNCLSGQHPGFRRKSNGYLVASGFPFDFGAY